MNSKQNEHKSAEEMLNALLGPTPSGATPPRSSFGKQNAPMPKVEEETEDEQEEAPVPNEQRFPTAPQAPQATGPTDTGWEPEAHDFRAAPAAAETEDESRLRAERPRQFLCLFAALALPFGSPFWDFPSRLPVSLSGFRRPLQH